MGLRTLLSRCLSRLLKIFGGYSHKKEDLGPVSPEENLTRYVFSRKHFSPEKGIVKYGAFLPDSNGETSVFRISNLDDVTVWQIGRLIVAPGHQSPLRARADIVTQSVLEEGLRVTVAPAPHPRHANIIGWSSDGSKHRLVALKLAEKANLILHDNYEEL